MRGPAAIFLAADSISTKTPNGIGSSSFAAFATIYAFNLH